LGRGREFRQETKTQVERVSRVAVDNVEARVVIACVDTFLHYAEEITKIEQASIAVPATA